MHSKKKKKKRSKKKRKELGSKNREPNDVFLMFFSWPLIKYSNAAWNVTKENLLFVVSSNLFCFEGK